MTIRNKTIRRMPGFSRRTKHNWNDLYHLYVDEQLTLSDIGRIKGVRDCVVRYAVITLGIPLRSKADTFNILKHRGVYSHCGNTNPSWKGGTCITSDGYISIHVPREHPFISMATRVRAYGRGGGYIRQHRLIMAEYLNRPLLPNEIVHHINGIKTDNRLENLELIIKKGHSPSLHLEQRVKELEGRMTMLEAENAMLKQQLNTPVPIPYGDKNHK